MHRSKGFTTGLVIAGLLALGDLTTPLFTDGEHPPMAVALVCAALGLITAVALPAAWRRQSRGAVTAIIVTRLLSAVTALPAFVADGVPAGAKVAAAAGILIAAATVALLAPRLRRPAPVAA
jgi:hypothetical protein